MNKARQELFEIFIKSSLNGYDLDAETIDIDPETSTIKVTGLTPSWEKAVQWANIKKSAMGGTISKVEARDDQITIEIPSEDDFAARVRIGSQSQISDKHYLNALKASMKSTQEFK